MKSLADRMERPFMWFFENVSLPVMAILGVVGTLLLIIVIVAIGLKLLF